MFNINNLYYSKRFVCLLSISTSRRTNYKTKLYEGNVHTSNLRVQQKLDHQQGSLVNVAAEEAKIWLKKALKCSNAQFLSPDSLISDAGEGTACLLVALLFMSQTVGVGSPIILREIQVILKSLFLLEADSKL